VETAATSVTRLAITVTDTDSDTDIATAVEVPHGAPTLDDFVDVLLAEAAQAVAAVSAVPLGAAHGTAAALLRGETRPADAHAHLHLAPTRNVAAAAAAAAAEAVEATAAATPMTVTASAATTAIAPELAAEYRELDAVLRTPLTRATVSQRAPSPAQLVREEVTAARIPAAMAAQPAVMAPPAAALAASAPAPVPAPAPAPAPLPTPPPIHDGGARGEVPVPAHAEEDRFALDYADMTPAEKHHFAMDYARMSFILSRGSRATAAPGSSAGTPSLASGGAGAK